MKILKDMYGDIPEQEMIEKIFAMWGDGYLDQLQWFISRDGSTRSITKHPLNRALQEVTCESY
eukprot:2526353-Karenia_brevis.AAC.1